MENQIGVHEVGCLPTCYQHSPGLTRH